MRKRYIVIPKEKIVGEYIKDVWGDFRVFRFGKIELVAWSKDCQLHLAPAIGDTYQGRYYDWDADCYHIGKITYSDEKIVRIFWSNGCSNDYNTFDFLQRFLYVKES